MTPVLKYVYRFAPRRPEDKFTASMYVFAGLIGTIWLLAGSPT